MLAIHLCGMSIYLIEQQGEIFPSLGNNYLTKGNSFGTMRLGVWVCVCVCVCGWSWLENRFVALISDRDDIIGSWCHCAPGTLVLPSYSALMIFHILDLIISCLYFLVKLCCRIESKSFGKTSSRFPKTLPVIHLNRNWACFVGTPSHPPWPGMMSKAGLTCVLQLFL